MTEKVKNNELLNYSNELEKKITSPSTIDYLAGKVKEHNIGIKLERRQPNGSYESLSIQDIVIYFHFLFCLLY